MHLEKGIGFLKRTKKRIKRKTESRLFVADPRLVKTFCGEQEIINLGLTKGRGYDILYIVTLYHTKIQKVTEIRDFSRKALSPRKFSTGISFWRRNTRKAKPECPGK